MIESVSFPRRGLLQVKSVISQIEGHKNGIREIEIEIETIRGEERQKSHEKTWEDKDQHPTI